MTGVFNTRFPVATAAVIFALAVGDAAWMMKFSRSGPGLENAVRFSRAIFPAQPAVGRSRVATAASSSDSIEPDAAAKFTALSDEELLALVRSRPVATAEDALAWAQSQDNPDDRERLLFASVRLWAERDPIAAVRWALARPDVGTARWIEAALNGAAGRPELAVSVGRMLLAADPELGQARGLTLVDALTGAGRFTAAVEFADAAPADLREDWLAAAFRRWGAQRPEEALQALHAIPEETLRASLFPSLAAGWGDRDPAALTAYVAGLPESPARDGALREAMLQWGVRNPAALAAWLNTQAPGPEFDAGAALLVTRTDQANRSIDVALRWVESISALEPRRDSLSHVLLEWAQTDPAAAREYLARVPWLSREERTGFLQTMEQAGQAGPET